MIFLILFVVLPILEITTFIYVGGYIGVLNTLMLSFLMAIIGGIIVRSQGLETFINAQKAFGRGEVPTSELFDGLLIVLAAGLLITPGFVTDIVGFLLLVPAVRRFVQHMIKDSARLNISGFNVDFTEFYETRPHHKPLDPDIIEAEYKNITEQTKPKDKP